MVSHFKFYRINKLTGQCKQSVDRYKDVCFVVLLLFKEVTTICYIHQLMAVKQKKRCLFRPTGFIAAVNKCVTDPIFLVGEVLPFDTNALPFNKKTVGNQVW